jgi:hypothetical protein
MPDPITPLPNPSPTVPPPPLAPPGPTGLSTPPPEPVAQEGEDLGHIPTEEVPDVLPPRPSAYPMSSAPLPEDVEIKTSTESVQ